MNGAAQKCAGGEHDGFCIKTNAGLRDNTGDALALDKDIIGGLLENIEIDLVF